MVCSSLLSAKPKPQPKPNSYSTALSLTPSLPPTRWYTRALQAELYVRHPLLSVERLRAFALDLASGRLDDLFLNGDVDHVYPQAASFCKYAHRLRFVGRVEALDEDIRTLRAALRVEPAEFKLASVNTAVEVKLTLTLTLTLSLTLTLTLNLDPDPNPVSDADPEPKPHPNPNPGAAEARGAAVSVRGLPPGREHPEHALPPARRGLPAPAPPVRATPRVRGCRAEDRERYRCYAHE